MGISFFMQKMINILLYYTLLSFRIVVVVVVENITDNLSFFMKKNDKTVKIHLLIYERCKI